MAVTASASAFIDRKIPLDALSCIDDSRATKALRSGLVHRKHQGSFNG
jgi:hypothetical protein